MALLFFALLAGATSTRAAAAPRSTLAVYLDALSISDASPCALHFPGAMATDTAAPSSGPSERFILSTLLGTHPEAASLTACLLSSGLVPAAVVKRLGGALLFAAASPRLFAATTAAPAALFTSLLTRGAARNYTLGRGDNFNLLHKLLSADKRTPDDMANVLLQPSLARGSFLETLALGIAEGLPAPTAAAALAAGRDLLRSHALGRPVASSAASALARAMSLRLLRALAAAPPPPHQPTLAALAAQRDKFGRSPLHMAALQDSAAATALLAAALLAELPPAQAARALCARDAAGFTALDLALCLGHSLAARELQRALGAACPLDVPSPATSLLPAALAPAFPSPRSTRAAATPPVGDGGWGAPTRMSVPARAALAAAAAAAASTGGCDVDVLSIEELTASHFVQEHFLPLRPVLVRGLAAPLARAWRRNVLLRAHGSLAVNPAGIPYAASFGGAGGGGMSLADFVGRHLVVGSEAGDAGPGSGNATSYVFQRLSPASALARHSMLLAPPFLAQALLPLAGHNTSIPLLLPTPDALSPELFLGPPGSGAPMHYHGDALNFLAWGRKEWFLQPPAAAEYSTAAAVDFVAHELPGLRREGRAPLQCSQAAGDALYVPRGWGHAVLNLNTSVGWVVEFSTAMRRY